MSSITQNIKSYKVVYPQIYSYTLPELKANEGSQKIGYLERDKISKNQEWINKFKVYVARANNIGTELNYDNLNTFIGKPKTICAETYIILGDGLNVNQIVAENISKYFKTKFARF